MKVGTRGSALALWQATSVAQLITQATGRDCEIVVIRTSGDERAGPPDTPRPPAFDTAAAPAANVKRTFVKEIEDALLDGRIDVAVHSSKDLPADLPAGLIIGAALAREDARDAVVLPSGARASSLHEVRAALGPSPRLGTSSIRRAAELRAWLPRATFVPIRGNVDTRLRKLDAGDCDAIVLAAAGLKRLGLAARISFALPIDTCVPAPGQGIVAVEVRETAPAGVHQTLAAIIDPDAAAALIAEREVVRALGGSCQMPLGAHATLDGDDLSIQGVVASPDGTRVVRALVHGRRATAAETGRELAERLLEHGAADVLHAAR
jgi:hydroxymethylbilane synthase